MTNNQLSANGSTPERPTQRVLALNEVAIDAVRASAEQPTPSADQDPWRKEVVDLLNGALATELVCVLRYRRHHFTADGMAASKIADELLVHSNEEMDHADRLARRIVQLGGEPDFSPDTLTARSHADYNAAPALRDMIRSNLVAERVAIESYTQMIRMVGDTDPTTRRLLEDILATEQEHADELQGWLAD